MPHVLAGLACVLHASAMLLLCLAAAGRAADVDSRAPASLVIGLGTSLI